MQQRLPIVHYGKDWVEEVGEKKMAGVFHSYDSVGGGAGPLLVSVSPVKVNLDYYSG